MNAQQFDALMAYLDALVEHIESPSHDGFVSLAVRKKRLRALLLTHPKG